MDFSFSSKSVVIVANHHNPTIVTEHFLIKSGIIKTEEEVDQNNLIITPSISQIFLKDETKISIEPHKLTINHHEDEKRVYEIGQKYCIHLPHIIANAVGLNFEVELPEDFDIRDWFSKSEYTPYRNSEVNGIDFVFDVNEAKAQKCNVKVFKGDNGQGRLRFNYHHPFNNIPLGEIDLDFAESGAHYQQYCTEFINNLFDQ